MPQGARCKRRPFFSDGGSGAKELRLQAAGAISESMMAVEAAGAKEDQAVGPEDDIEDAGNIEEVEQAMAQLLHHYQLTDTRDENSDYDSGLEEEVSCNSDDDDVFHPE